MNKKNTVFVKLIVLLLLLGLAIPHDSLKEVFAASDEAARNQIYLDVTYDPETQTYSLIGLSDQQLRALGAPVLEGIVWQVLARFDSLSMAINNSQLSLKTNDMSLATINWDEESREMLYGLINSYGMQMTDTSKERLAVWMDDLDIVLNVRNSPDLSQPLVLNLDTLLQVDISNEGQVAVEGFDTGFALEPGIPEMAAAGGVDNATVCWSKGVLVSQVNGAALPQITVHQEGLEVVDQALGLGLGDVEQYFLSQLGASVSFGGAEHEITECAP
jgi:hypothetical protein